MHSSGFACTICPVAALGRARCVDLDLPNGSNIHMRNIPMAGIGTGVNKWVQQCLLLRQVAEALEDSGMRERAPVGVLKRRLMSLQADVAAAHERLHTTEVKPLARASLP